MRIKKKIRRIKATVVEKGKNLLFGAAVIVGGGALVMGAGILTWLMVLAAMIATALAVAGPFVLVMVAFVVVLIRIMFYPALAFIFICLMYSIFNSSLFQ